uniref:Uncharacterized protein LOC114328536 n=1 Tax=Diabrotica virgifera virgifera TaxID=50390 RepID=A0A6P7FJ29_DIAVI
MKIAKDKTELTKKALKLALKYSFVTEVTSLVVVKPNSTRPIYPDDGYLRSEGQEYSTPAFDAYNRGGPPAGGQLKVAYSAQSSSSFVSNRGTVVHVQQKPRPRRPRVRPSKLTILKVS